MGFELQSAGHGKNTNVECKFITFEDKPGHNVKLRGYSEADWKKISIWDRIGARLSRNCFDVKVTKDGKEEKFVIVKDKFFKHSFSGEKTLPSSSQVCQMLTTASKGKIREDHTLERQDQQQGEAAKPPVGGQKPDGSRVVEDMPAPDAALPRPLTKVGALGPKEEPSKVLNGNTAADRMNDLQTHHKQRLNSALTSQVVTKEFIKNLLLELAYGDLESDWANNTAMKSGIAELKKGLSAEQQAVIDQLVARHKEAPAK